MQAELEVWKKQRPSGKVTKLNAPNINFKTHSLTLYTTHTKFNANSIL